MIENPENIVCLLDLFIRAESYKNATNLAKSLIIFKNKFSVEQCKEIVEAYSANSQIKFAYSVKEYLEQILLINKKNFDSEFISKIKEKELTI